MLVNLPKTIKKKKILHCLKVISLFEINMTEYIIIAQYKMITVLQNFTASVNVKLCFQSAAPSLFHNTHGHLFSRLLRPQQ